LNRKEGILVTERERAVSIGLTAEEAECWELAASLAGKFFELPKLHQMDDHEVAHAIHVIQNKLLGRPAYRKYLRLAHNEAGSGAQGTSGQKGEDNEKIE
jgi:hypothetical protein